MKGNITQENTAPMCHFKPMKWQAGDSDDCGNYEEWFECSYCGCIKDKKGNKVKNDH